MNNINQFLIYIQGTKENIVKVYKFIPSLNRKAMVKIKADQISKENKNGDIYYVVNSGSDRDDGITNFNAVFIDLDCGRDNDNNYYSLEKVKEYKHNKITEIHKFKTKPTFIIETRNGLHVYWVLKGEVNVADWKECMNKLIAKFDGDKQVNNPARLMRLPFTKWMKDISNPFDIQIVEFNDVKYSIETMLKGLGDVSVEKTVHDKRSINNNTYLSCTEKPNYIIQAIKDGNIEYLHSILKPQSITLPTQQTFYEYITQEINLYDFLGVSGKTFACVFHNDKSPSAGIFVSERNQYLYKCFSNNCNFIGNIIRCVERLRKCNRPQAINFIKSVYKINIEDTEWQRTQREILEENKRMIREGELQEHYPELHKFIEKYKSMIYEIHDIAMDNIYDEKYADDSNNPIFFASIRYIAEKLDQKSFGRMTERIGVLAFLLLLHKLPEDKVPEQLLTTAKHIAATKNHKALVNFFSIPSYCDENLLLSLERAKLYKDNNMSMVGWSRELLQRTFGDEIANEVYPQFKHRKITKKSQEKTMDIHTVVNKLIQFKQYAMEKEVIEILRETYGKTRTEIQIKKCLQEMLDSYGLQRIRANKQIKEQYGITSNGYPFIIVQN